MKAEERHRLQENDLHRFAEHARERSRPFFDRFGVPLLLGLAAVLIVIAAYVWWSKRATADRGEGWDALAAAFRAPDATAENFGAVADAYPDSKAAVWARLYEGEARLGTAIESLFSAKEGAIRDLTDAQEAFEAVLNQPELDDEVKVRALYGLARSLEASSDGDLKPAIDRYEQIVKEFPGSVYEDLAQERVDALSTPEAKDFYAWFSKAKPTLQDPLLRPQDGSSPISMPGLPSGGPALPTGGAPTGGAPASDNTPSEAPKPSTSATTAPPAASDDQSASDAEADAAASETPAPEGDSSGGPALGGPQ
ncbi:MAG: tetratricopeptide repeat protein [Planctomycetaceae bacterium]